MKKKKRKKSFPDTGEKYEPQKNHKKDRLGKKFDIALRMKREGDIAKIFLLFDRDEERRRYKYIHTFITEEKNYVRGENAKRKTA